MNWGGVAVDPTRNLIFVNSKDEATVGWTVPNPRYSAATGRELWSYALPYHVTAIPITYSGSDGRQYVAVTAARSASGAPGDEGLYVFARPR